MVYCGVIKAIMNLSRYLGVCPYALTSLIFVLAALSQKVQGSGKSRNYIKFEKVVGSLRQILGVDLGDGVASHPTIINTPV